MKLIKMIKILNKKKAQKLLGGEMINISQIFQVCQVVEMMEGPEKGKKELKRMLKNRIDFKSLKKALKKK